MRILWVLGAWAAAALLAWLFSKRVMNRTRSRERLGEREEDRALLEEEEATEEEADPLGLRLWLVQAGLRARGAPQIFMATAVICLITGILTAYVLIATGGVEQGYALVQAIPGATGDLLYFILVSTPWLALIVITSVPWVYVRAKRRTRAETIDKDMPITLELLSTLAQAGLGLDASLVKLLESQDPGRPLAQELKLYQLETLTGVPRIQCLRRLSRRIGISSVSTFISAIVQAEQVGAGMADVLQRQADDLRNRRRENAMALAQSVPVKLTFPLVICFLPGIFVTTLGPTFHQFFQLAESVIRDIN